DAKRWPVLLRSDDRRTRHRRARRVGGCARARRDHRRSLGTGSRPFPLPRPPFPVLHTRNAPSERAGVVRFVHQAEPSPPGRVPAAVSRALGAGMNRSLVVLALAAGPAGGWAQSPATPDTLHQHGDSLTHPFRLTAVTITASPARREDPMGARRITPAAIAQ